MKRYYLLMLLIALSLVACGSPDDDFNDPVTEVFEAPPTEEETAEPPGDAPSEEEAPAEEDMPEEPELPGPIALPYEHPFIGQTSEDGEYILFSSFTPDPINEPDLAGTPHVVLYNTQTDEVTLVSKAEDGTPADFWSVEESLAADGSSVVFWSYSSNLVPEEAETVDCTAQAPSCGDVYIYTVESGAIERIALEAGYGIGLMNDTDISFGGRYVTFASNVSEAYPGGWLYDTAVDELVQISESAIAVRVSDDGRTVAYVNGFGDNGIYVLDRVTEEVTPIGGPDPSDTLMDGMIMFNEGASAAVEMTPDARYVAYVSSRPGIVDGDFVQCETYFGAAYPVCQHVYVHDLQTGEVDLISSSSDGVPGDQVSDLINITADGRFVLFRSQATNLTPAGGMVENNPFISALYLKDRQTGRVYLVSRGPDGRPVNGWGFLTTDGTQIIFNMGDDVFGQNVDHFVVNIADLIE